MTINFRHIYEVLIRYATSVLKVVVFRFVLFRYVLSHNMFYGGGLGRAQLKFELNTLSYICLIHNDEYYSVVLQMDEST